MNVAQRITTATISGPIPYLCLDAKEQDSTTSYAEPATICSASLWPVVSIRSMSPPPVPWSSLKPPASADPAYRPIHPPPQLRLPSRGRVWVPKLSTKLLIKFWILAAVVVTAPLAFAQQTQTPAQPPPQSPQPQPKVLFSGQPPSEDQNPATNSAPIADAERQSVVITAWDLDLHLNGVRQSIDALARQSTLITTFRRSHHPHPPPAFLHAELRKASPSAAKRFPSPKPPSPATPIPHRPPARSHRYIPLADPLPPQSQLNLLIEYTGTIPLTAERLTAIGAPDSTAQTTDWDRISEDFTGVRGFGNVVWYPVASVPVSRADGANLYFEIGRQKLLDQDATVSHSA